MWQTLSSKIVLNLFDLGVAGGISYCIKYSIADSLCQAHSYYLLSSL